MASTQQSLEIYSDKYGWFHDVAANGVSFRMRWIEPDSFTMGSPEDEPGRLDNEAQVDVTLTSGYWLADTQCTQELWRAVMGTSPSSFSDDKLPVEHVRWEECKAFCAKLTELLDCGIKFKLPTEAQWEYACRAGTTAAYSTGDELTADQACFEAEQPRPVASFKPNAWGLYDMHGNVWEWCADRYGEKLAGGDDPTGATSGQDRVLRGGRWLDHARDCRSAFRDGWRPGGRLLALGFRLAGVPVEPSKRAEPASDDAPKVAAVQGCESAATCDSLASVAVDLRALTARLERLVGERYD